MQNNLMKRILTFGLSGLLVFGSLGLQTDEVQAASKVKAAEAIKTMKVYDSLTGKEIKNKKTSTIAVPSNYEAAKFAYGYDVVFTDKIDDGTSEASHDVKVTFDKKAKKYIDEDAVTKTITADATTVSIVPEKDSVSKKKMGFMTIKSIGKTTKGKKISRKVKVKLVPATVVPVQLL
jgi:hypothetical protein